MGARAPQCWRYLLPVRKSGGVYMSSDISAHRSRLHVCLVRAPP